MTLVMTAVVVMATIAGRSWSLVQEPRDDEPLTCVEGRVRCLGDVTCKVLMETISKVCDESSKLPFSGHTNIGTVFGTRTFSVARPQF